MGRRTAGKESWDDAAIFYRMVLVVVVGLFASSATTPMTRKGRGLNGDVFSTSDASGARLRLGAVASAGVYRADRSSHISGPRRPGDPDSSPVTPRRRFRTEPIQTQGEAGSGQYRISANPPNGTVFAGRGKYQLYRQGDLTWRLNTETGQTCIIFATDDEWRKPRVYRAGCGARSGG